LAKVPVLELAPHLVQVEERLPVSLPVLELEQGQERASG
jgi:hypothetical protein